MHLKDLQQNPNPTFRLNGEKRALKKRPFFSNQNMAALKKILALDDGRQTKKANIEIHLLKNCKKCPYFPKKLPSKKNGRKKNGREEKRSFL